MEVYLRGFHTEGGPVCKVGLGGCKAQGCGTEHTEIGHRRSTNIPHQPAPNYGRCEGRPFTEVDLYVIIDSRVRVTPYETGFILHSPDNYRKSCNRLVSFQACNWKLDPIEPQPP